MHKKSEPLPKIITNESAHHPNTIIINIINMCTPQICTLYSLSGTLFLLFVYTLLSSTQNSFYIRGINSTNHDLAKRNALGGMILFLVLLLGSLGWSFWKGRRGRNGNFGGDGGGSQYELIDGASERSLDE